MALVNASWRWNCSARQASSRRRIPSAQVSAARRYAEERSVDLRPIELDVASDDSVRAAIGRILAEAEGIDKILLKAGFEWREPGCSMCLAMNPDKLAPGERCASTSNRNFEGRQGYKGRTHLVSPVMAAAAAIAGHFVDVREWQ